MTTTAATHGVTTLLDEYVAAQRGSDAERLDELLAPDFTLVGPLGYVVPREGWLAQYRAGRMRNREFSLVEPQVRIYGSSAVVIAQQAQRASYDDHDASGSFRVTLIATTVGDRWVLAGAHLSPMPPASPPERP